MQVLRALAAAWVTDVPAAPVQEANAVLLDVRGELHKRTRGRDKLLLQEQDGIAAALGYADADALAHAVADAGRTIAWAYDSAWRRAEGVLTPRGPGRRFGRSRRPDRRPLADGVVEQNGEVVLARDADPAADPVLVLRAAEASARAGVPLAPHTLDRLAAESAPLPTPWHGLGPRRFHRLVGDRAGLRWARWRPSTTPGCSCGCCRSGGGCAASRSETPCTGSPSTGTCWRPWPRPRG